MKLIFATNNRHKLEEVSAILGSDVELGTPAEWGITEDIPETGMTLEDNARQKAWYVYERVMGGGADKAGVKVGAGTRVGAGTGVAFKTGAGAGTGIGAASKTGAEVVVGVFADDTGLEVAALDGAPGVRSARYAADAGKGSGPAGEGTYDDNNRLLLHALEGVKDRSARFRTVIALLLCTEDGSPEEHLFEGMVQGRIIDHYRGEGGFGYDPVFIPDGSSLTFAQMSAEQKNGISHRARAVEKLTEFLKK